LTTVTVYWPPISGSFLGNPTHLEVEITRQVQTSLVPAEAAFNPVRARGVAGAENLQSGYAIMALDPNNTQYALWAQSGADVHVNGGGILVNSGASDAARNDQNVPSRFTVQSPYALDVHGQAVGYWSQDNVPVNGSHPQVDDPFALFPKPDITGMTVYTSLPAPVGGVTTLEPGVYKVLIKGAGTDEFHLNPGVYVVEKGFDTSGNGIMNGTDIFIYNTYTTYPNNPGLTPSCSDVEISGNGIVTLSAMTTGTWANMLFFQDPACTNDFEIAGNAVFTGDGSFYLPNAPFKFNGNNATLNGSQLIAKTVNIENGNLTINYNPNNTAQPILPRLAE
jgi:hypothetical protein